MFPCALLRCDMPAIKHLRRKQLILASVIFAFVVLGTYAIIRWRSPSNAELAHIYRVAYTYPAITNFTGSVVQASVALIPKDQRAAFSSYVPQDWIRERTPTGISGKARMFIVGNRNGGFFTISYTYNSSTDDFRLQRVSGPADN